VTSQDRLRFSEQLVGVLANFSPARLTLAERDISEKNLELGVSRGNFAVLTP
jgi:hypothetical protein